MIQKTAIQQLIEKLEKRGFGFSTYAALINEALALEKEQLIDAFKSANTIQGSKEWHQSEAEQYYNTKYNPKN